MACLNVMCLAVAAYFTSSGKLEADQLLGYRVAVGGKTFDKSRGHCAGSDNRIDINILIVDSFVRLYENFVLVKEK